MSWHGTANNNARLGFHNLVWKNHILPIIFIENTSQTCLDIIMQACIYRALTHQNVLIYIINVAIKISLSFNSFDDHSTANCETIEQLGSHSSSAICLFVVYPKAKQTGSVYKSSECTRLIFQTKIPWLTTN